MPTSSKTCPDPALIQSLARGELSGDERRRAERLLEQNEICRELFRSLTAGHFPLLPNYTILAQVGKGGFGVVYKAVHHAKERVEALKVLFSKTPLMTSYFENEVHLIARLRHPHIATLYEAQLSTPPFYYTMEFVEGQRLNDFLKQRQVSLAERIRIIQEVAVAIGYAHEKGVIHRDLKPQNILIDADGRPNIVDFGIAKKLALAEAAPLPEDQKEGPVGTVGYIAPEQVAGRQADGRADVFALGALLFHCVTGEPARHATDRKRCLEVLRERQVSEPEDLAAIILQCVALAPDDRYNTCTEFVADLENYLAGRPINARSDRSIVAQVARMGALQLRNHPYAVLAVILATVSVLLTGLFSTLGVQRVIAGGLADRTVIIALSDRTEELIRAGEVGQEVARELGIVLELAEGPPRHSLRALYGRLFEKLANADPLVVAWDAYLPICAAEPVIDEALLRGMNALKRRDVPLIIGAANFDINGEPIVCPRISSAAHAIGTLLSTTPAFLSDQYEVVLSLKRGFNPAIPSLPLAAYAATKFPDCDVDLEIERNRSQPSLHVRYEFQNPSPDESRWRKETDELPLHQVLEVPDRSTSWLDDLMPDNPGAAQPGDVLAHMRVSARSNALWNERTFAFEDVLNAEPEQLRDWFQGKAIVLGQMISGKDQHPLQGGESVWGCQVHAETLDSLLGNIRFRPLERSALAMRVCAWCVLAGLLVAVHKPRWRGLTGARAGLLCCGIAAAGLFVGVYATVTQTTQWVVELGIALSALLAGGGLAMWARLARDRQLSLTPAAVSLPATDSVTLPSTVLADSH